MGQVVKLDELSNLAALRRNPYPGRGIIAGLNASSSDLVQVYWLMGRSANSRNRVFKSDGKGRLYTEAADPTKVVDPSLIIYNAMSERKPHFVVSNGNQTDHVVKQLLHYPHYLQPHLSTIAHEPDDPNFTPRITAVSSVHYEKYIVQLSILRRSQWGDTTDRFFYQYEEVPPGFGLCLTTYKGDGDPLPSFSGEPLLMPLGEEITEIARMYWDALNPDNRVALAVKFITRATSISKIHIINKFEQAG
jgi:IMP cyclohydrolase